MARALARDPSDAEDLVAEAFVRVLAALRTGAGPREAFRAYLLTALRNAHYDRAKRDRRVEPTEDMSRYEAPAARTSVDPAVAGLERSYAARAFARLPERWQLVLWHTEVEGEKPASVAPLLGLTPNAVAALAYRARERLRQMYLQEHLSTTGDPSCHWAADRLGAYVRRGLPRRERSRVDSHLASCEHCRTLWIELAEVNSGLRGVLAPVVLGAAAGPYLEATAGGAGLWAGLMRPAQAAWAWLLRQVRRLVERYGPGNVAAAAGVAAATLVGVALFAVAMVVDPDPPGPGGPDPREGPPRAVQPGIPVPTPGPRPSPSGAPAPTGTPDPDRPAAQPDPGPPAAPVPPGPPAAEPGAPEPGPVVVEPDLSGTTLTAGDDGELALAVRLPPRTEGVVPVHDQSPKEASQLGVSSPFRAPDHGAAPVALAAAEVAPAAEVALAVRWPAGITLTGPDAGDGWRCTAGETGAACRRPAWPAGEVRTARLPVSVDPALGGLAPLEVAVTAGAATGQSRVRVPVAPAGMRVGYAATGPYRLAVAGNTWLSCPDRPECLEAAPLDNDLVDLVPYLDADAPGDLPADDLAVSGAEVAVPPGASVAWAGLWWATVAGTGPTQVAMHGPDGQWHQVPADAAGGGADRPLWQAYAEVTDLVRAAPQGPWWLAAAAGELPAGPAVSAGWSLTVVYEEPGGATRDVAVLAGPVSVDLATPLAASTDADGAAVDVALVAWEGDRRHPGAGLRLGEVDLGETTSRAAGAQECGGAPARSCPWHTFGVDAARYAGEGGPVALTTSTDLVEVGVLALAVVASG